MNEMTTFRWSLFDDVCGYRAAGIGGIGIWLPKLSEFGEERGIDLVRDSGLHVSSLSSVGGFTGQNRQSFDDAMSEARDAIVLAGELGADAVSVISGGRSGHTRNHARRLLVSALSELGDEAAHVGVKLGVGPMLAHHSHDWTFLHTLDEALEILDRCRHPAVGLHFDAYHLRGEARLLDRIGEIARRTAIVQLSDWDGRSASPSCARLPGDGILPLSEIADAFSKGGYRGYFEVSVCSEDIWKSDYDLTLSDCVARYRRLSPVELLAPNRPS